jgi:hypothetical protein
MIRYRYGAYSLLSLFNIGTDKCISPMVYRIWFLDLHRNLHGILPVLFVQCAQWYHSTVHGDSTCFLKFDLFAGVQLYPTSPPKHAGEYAPVPVPSHYGRILSPSASCWCWLGLDCWQVTQFLLTMGGFSHPQLAAVGAWSGCWQVPVHTRFCSPWVVSLTPLLTGSGLLAGT